MGSKKTVTITSTPDEIKLVKVKKDAKSSTKGKQDKAEIKATDKDNQASQENTVATEAENAVETKVKVAKPKKVHSKKYQIVRSKVDRTQSYDLTAAIELVKKLSYTKFPGTVSAHLIVKEIGLSKEITFPHTTGQSKVIEIASEETIKKIEAGKIDFDILLSTPQFMAKLTKYAAILGPKGLMPNPKNGTLSPNPEKREKELAAGAVTIKTEKKAPLIHVAIGSTKMDTKELVENLQALAKAFANKIEKITISATMSPGIKVTIEKEA